MRLRWRAVNEAACRRANQTPGLNVRESQTGNTCASTGQWRTDDLLCFQRVREFNSEEGPLLGKIRFRDSYLAKPNFRDFAGK